MKLGVIIPDLATSQISYMAIQYVNGIIADTEIDCTIFYEDMFQPCVKPLCATMCINELWSFQGTVVATNLSTARALANTVGRIKKVFYIHDLEWMRGHTNYLDNLFTYRHPELSLVARSDYHAKAIKNYTNREPEMIEPTFNLYKILRGIK